MIIIRLKGGLGNQMFQYAFGKAMTSKLNTEMKLDCSLLLDRARGRDFVYREYDISIFNIQEQFTVSPFWLRLIFKLRFSAISRWVKNLLAIGKTVVKEKHFHVDRELIDHPIKDAIYDGWWQSEMYFESVKEIIRKEFTFKQPLLILSQDLLGKIKQTNSVCLNVRRTDFVTNPTLNTTDQSYFLKSVKKMLELVEQPHFFIFSDDIQWCKDNLQLDHPMDVVSHDHKGYKFGNYLQLMKSCKHFIIPNSSFAWWAVWLNENPKKHVIAPKKWFNEDECIAEDLIPSIWVRL